MAVHVVLNQKGGVGKSTISVNLAAVTADVLNHGDDPDASSPVLALSVDPQGSAVWWASRINDLPFHIAQAHDDVEGLKKLKDLRGIEHVYVDTPGWIDLDSDDDSSDPLEMVHFHIAGKPVPPRERRASVPEAVNDIVMKLLQKEPENRYQSADELLGALTEVNVPAPA